MTRIDVGDGDTAREGLLTLIVTVLELLFEALEREAIRRMDGGLSEAEIERLGRQLARIEAEIEQLKRDEGIEGSVDSLRGDLDGIVMDAIERVENEADASGPGVAVFGGEES